MITHSSRRALRWTAALAFIAFAEIALAQSGAAPPPLTQGDEVLQMPSLGRILFGFTVAVGLAFAIVYGLRRYLPRVAGQVSPSGGLRVLERIQLQRTTRIHLLQVESVKVLVAENRDGLSMVVLPVDPAKDPPVSP